MNILKTENLDIYYDKKLVLKDVNISFEKNKISCIMGSSGGGKTSLLSAFNGFLENKGGHYKGEIFLNGKNIKELKKEELRKNISTLFQDSKPFDLSIEKNLSFGLNYHYKSSETSSKIIEILKTVNLYDEVKNRLKEKAKNLSGGQKQRLCIGRMLTANPKILIFDEPCSNLDFKNTIIIENLLKKLSQNYTLIVATHNPAQAKRIGDFLYFVEDGKVREESLLSL